MNSINFTVTGGFPFDQSILKFLQDETMLLQNVCAAFGPLVIVSGCTEAGDGATAGVMIINGEILQFNGGVLADKVIIVDTPTALTYEDGSEHGVISTRVATFGDDGIQNNPWADFARIPEGGLMAALNSQWMTGDVKEIDVTEAYIVANFDGTGLGINERVGWAICNGSNGTKNRLGRVSVMRDGTQAEFETMGQTGGEKVHLLTKDESGKPAGLPPGLDGPHNKPGDGGGAAEYYVNGPLGTGGNASSPHNNLQPYIVTLFIQKL